jgi:prolyl 4-hydroxylase
MYEIDLGGVNSFIGAWMHPDPDVCEELIRYFRMRGDKTEGQIGHDRAVVKAIKESIDVIVTPDQFNHPPVLRYILGLREVASRYCEKFQAAGAVNPWSITESINLQYYPPGGGYKEWHTERIGKQAPSCNRHLVFMTYLNDVNEEGGTEFFYQRLRTRARRGLTLIWPVDWTHLHRGIVAPAEEKFIVTGWFGFL